MLGHPQAGPGAPRRLQVAAPYLLAALFAGSAVIHLTRPDVFLSLVPHWLPQRRDIVIVSGLAELGCATALAARRPWAGEASAVLLAVVWVGNIQMAVTASHGTGHGLTGPWVAWGRVPLQVPLIWAALQARQRVVPNR